MMSNAFKNIGMLVGKGLQDKTILWPTALQMLSFNWFTRLKKPRRGILNFILTEALAKKI